jgi:LDH2 family malate/lactate/ureidoglycolate dehydrogenase
MAQLTLQEVRGLVSAALRQAGANADMAAAAARALVLAAKEGRSIPLGWALDRAAEANGIFVADAMLDSLRHAA